MFSGGQSPSLYLAVSTSSSVGGRPEALLCSYLWCPVPVLLWIFRKWSSASDHSSNWQVNVTSWSPMGESEPEKSPSVSKAMWHAAEPSKRKCWTNLEGVKVMCKWTNEETYSRCWLQLEIRSRGPNERSRSIGNMQSWQYANHEITSRLIWWKTGLLISASIPSDCPWLTSSDQGL